MIIPWKKNNRGIRKSVRQVSKEEQELLDFFNTVVKERGAPQMLPELQTRIALFEGLSMEDKIKETPPLYLALEDHVISNQPSKRCAKIKLRQKIQKKHPSLEKYSNITIIFQSLEQQELMLCHSFLKGIVDKSKAIGYATPLELLDTITSFLESATTTISSNSMESQKQLVRYSNRLFLELNIALGEHITDNIYVTTYKRHFQAYSTLDAFAATFRMIPEALISKDLINFPSKQQMFKMLQKQLKSMEEINDKLSQEIVDRKRVEDELKQSEYLQSKILETAMDGIILVDSIGTVLSWNKQAEHILELPKEYTLGQSIFDIIPEKFRTELRNSFKNYMATGQDEIINRRIETAINKKDGSPLFIELTIIAIETKQGYMFNAFFRDITKRKSMDREIIEAKVVAEKSAKAKSVFLSNMSHEIRTPLNVILGLTGILQKEYEQLSETVQKNIDVIQFSAQNLLVLINDVLDFSKIEAGKYTLEENDFNLQGLLDNISSGFAIKAQEKGLDYIMTIDAKVPRFLIGDQFRLNQILTNLLGNAIKFTSKGNVTLTVSAIQETDAECSIQFCVSDTGIGIPDNKLQHIFNSFYQVHKPGKQKSEGTGLGLSISKQLIELHGSKLKAESTLNQGSSFEFVVTYPKSKLQLQEQLPVESENVSKKDCLSGIKVLVVEDNKMNQFFIQQLFSSWNIQSDIADNGTIALEKVHTSTYDLILMDMHMPVMDGLETTKHIRKSDDPKINTIPIIGCSADVFPEAKKNAIDSGMNFYITKPIAENDLKEILCTLNPNAMDNKTMMNASIKASQTFQKAIPKQQSTQFLNFQFLRNFFDNDTDIIKSILGIFLEETPKDYLQLKEAFLQKDIPLIGALAHKLKSSFQTIGLEQQSQTLAKMERLAKNSSCCPKELKALMTPLDQAYDTIIAEIKESFFYPIP